MILSLRLCHPPLYPQQVGGRPRPLRLLTHPSSPPLHPHQQDKGQLILPALENPVLAIRLGLWHTDPGGGLARGRPLRASQSVLFRLLFLVLYRHHTAPSTVGQRAFLISAWLTGFLCMNASQRGIPGRLLTRTLSSA